MFPPPYISQESVITIITIGEVSDKNKLISLKNEKNVKLIALDKPENYEKRLSEMSNSLTETVNNLTEEYNSSPDFELEIIYLFFILVEKDIENAVIVAENIQNIVVDPDVVSIITPKDAYDNKFRKYIDSYIEVSKGNSVSEVALEITNLVIKPGYEAIGFEFLSDLRASLWNKNKMKAAIVSAKKENYLEGVDATIEELELGKEALSKCDKLFFSISSNSSNIDWHYIKIISDYICDKLDDSKFTFIQSGTSECPELADDEVRIMIICDAD